MRITIASARYYNEEELIKEYPIIKEFNYNEHNQTIEINTIEDLISLRDKLNIPLIIELDNAITIYDDYIE